MSGIDIPEEYLAQMWEEIDWKASEEKLKELQKRLTIAVFKKNDKEVQDTQKRIVRDIKIKCLREQDKE